MLEPSEYQIQSDRTQQHDEAEPLSGIQQPSARIEIASPQSAGYAFGPIAQLLAWRGGNNVVPISPGEPSPQEGKVHGIAILRRYVITRRYQHGEPQGAVPYNMHDHNAGQSG